MQVSTHAISRLAGSGRTMIGEVESKQILAEYGVPTPRSVHVRGSGGIATSLANLAFPVCAKLSSPEGIHKSDVGGVRLGLEDASAVEAAVAELMDLAVRKSIAVDGCLIEEMVPGGVEVAIGGVNDPRFGPVLMVAMGGVFIELFHDVAFRVCPVDEHDANDMIEDLKAAALLDGLRGRPALDRAALVDVLMRIGGPDGLMQDSAAHIASLDINPVIVQRSGATAVDARIELKSAF